jgi:hypothetical protein
MIRGLYALFDIVLMSRAKERLHQVLFFVHGLLVFNYIRRVAAIISTENYYLVYRLTFWPVKLSMPQKMLSIGSTKVISISVWAP